MKVTQRRFLLRLVFAASALTITGLSSAQPSVQPYPTKPITLIVPFATGNIADNQSRMIAKQLATALGQPVVVENKPGASGMIGAELASRAPADGYTLMYGTHGTQAANLALQPHARINPSKELRGVHSLFRQSTVLVTPANRPWTSLQDLIATARATPDRISYASSGIGTQTHLAAAKFQEATKARLTHVPYNNQSSMTDLLAGNVDLAFSYAESVVQHIAAGKLRALAINGSARLAVLPDIPTVAEAGFPDAALEGWSGIFVPKGTPDHIIQQLALEIERATESDSTKAAMAKIGSFPMSLSDRAFQSFVEAEVPRWRKIVENAGAAAK